METEQKPTQETHPDSSQLNASGGDEAVTEQAVDPLALINEVTGREYKDLDSAKESIKEMQRQASQKQNLAAELEKAKATPKTDEELRAQVEQLTQAMAQNQSETFFATNPDHSANRTIIEDIARARGITAAEVVGLPEYQTIHDAQKTASEVQSKKTIADSNNRVAQPSSQDDMPQPGDKQAFGRYVAENFIK